MPDYDFSYGSPDDGSNQSWELERFDSLSNRYYDVILLALFEMEWKPFVFEAIEA